MTEKNSKEEALKNNTDKIESISLKYLQNKSQPTVN
jgi:hypothetical protein